MTYIKRLVMQGFKSFVRKTEIPLTNEKIVMLYKSYVQQS